jgi:hypothetical protein
MKLLKTKPIDSKGPNITKKLHNFQSSFIQRFPFPHLHHHRQQSPKQKEEATILSQLSATVATVACQDTSTGISPL